MNKLNSNILKFYIWRFISGFYFLFALQGIYPLSRGVTIPQLALFAGLMLFLTTLFEIPTGFVADRYSRKLSISLGFLCDALYYIGFLFIHNFYSMLPLAVLGALGNSLKSGALESLIFDELKHHSKEDIYLKTTARGSSLSTISGAIASLIGPILYSINFVFPFLLSAFASFILTLFVFTFQETRASQEVRKQLQILDGVKKIIKSKKIFLIVVINMLMLVFVTIYYQFLFFTKLNNLGIEVKYLGFIDVTTIILMSGVLYILPKLIFKNDKVNLIISTLSTCIAFIIFSNSSQLIIAIIFGILFDLLWTVRNHIVPSITNKYFESHDRALGLSSMSFISNLGAAILIPIATNIFKISYWFTIIPTMLMVILFYFYFKQENMRGNEV